MILKPSISQTKFLLKRKEACGVFCILSLLVIANFIGNVLHFQGRDVSQMYQPMKLLLLSYNRTNFNTTNTLLLVQLYPLLVVCPAGFSLAKEAQLGTQVYMVSRLGRRRYLASKYLAIFLATAIVFALPFLLEILLNCASFPLSATGDLSNLSHYDGRYQNYVNNYFMRDLYLFSPCLYAVIGTLLFGAFSGLLGVFTAAVSSLIKVKYNIFLFLPAFVLLNLPIGVRWYDHVLLFAEHAR